MGRRAPAPTASPTSIRNSRRRHTVISATDSRAPAPISAPGVRPERPCYTSPHPTGRGPPAPIESLPGTRPRRRCARIIVPRAVMLPRPTEHLQPPSLSGGAKSAPSTGRCAPAPTATPLGARPQRRVHSYPRPPHHRVPCPTGTRALAPTPTPPGARPERLSNWHPCFRTHCSNPRCPPSAARVQVHGGLTHIGCRC